MELDFFHLSNEKQGFQQIQIEMLQNVAVMEEALRKEKESLQRAVKTLKLNVNQKQKAESKLSNERSSTQAQVFACQREESKKGVHSNTDRDVIACFCFR